MDTRPLSALRRADRSVYFAQEVGGGPIKIGVAAHPYRRLRQLQTARSAPLRILAVTSGGRAAERVFHARFAEHRLHGEWFAPAEDIIRTVERLNNAVAERLSAARAEVR